MSASDLAPLVADGRARWLPIFSDDTWALRDLAAWAKQAHLDGIAARARVAIHRVRSRWLAMPGGDTCLEIIALEFDLDALAEMRWTFAEHRGVDHPAWTGCLLGIAQAAWAWDVYVERMPDGWRVVCPELRGPGRRLVDNIYFDHADEREAIILAIAGAATANTGSTP